MAVTISLASTQNGSVASSTLTITSAAIGTASADRIVTVFAGGACTVTNMTIGGVQATKQISSTGATSPFASIWTALVQTGTTGNIAMTSSVASGAMGLGVFAVTTADSATAKNKSAATAASTKKVSTTIVVDTGAKSISGWVEVATDVGTVTWTNATLSFQNSATVKYSAATSATSGSITITANSTGTTSTQSIVSVTFLSTVPVTAISQHMGESLYLSNFSKEIIGYHVN